MVNVNATAVAKRTNEELLSCLHFYVDYVQDKREYEDVAAMLREDVKMMKNRVDHLMHIIENRNNGEVDELSKKCAELVNKVPLY